MITKLGRMVTYLDGLLLLFIYLFIYLFFVLHITTHDLKVVQIRI